jgi:large subunit ribosomal protein L25
MASAKNDTIAVETRKDAGTTGARALRRLGRVPAVVFGHGAPPAAVSVDARALEELLHGGKRHHLLTITVDGGTKDTALLRSIQRDPVSRRVVHVDLQRVGQSESISTSIPIHITGTAPGVKDFGGVLDISMYTLEVTGPANELPEQIEVDVSALGLREHLTAGQITLPKSFKLDVSPDAVVVSVEAPRAQTDETATGAEGEAAAASPAAGAESES